MPVLDVDRLIQNRVDALRQAHLDSGIVRAELDISGGIDSAVMLGLLSRAIGTDNITALHTQINTNPLATERAQEVCDTFGVPLIVLDATPIFQAVVDGLNLAMIRSGYHMPDVYDRIAKDPTILGSIRSTLRAPLGRAANRLSGGGLRHGTGNEDEDRIIRFYQKGGDGEVDSNPIAMLSKGEVFQLALGLGVPASILNARPSPDLWGGTHNDEDEIAEALGHCGGSSEWMYSYVDFTTGKYKCVGMLERLHRWLDGLRPAEVHDFYGPDDLPKSFLSRAIFDENFWGLSEDKIHTLILRAQAIERRTRHKMNPNIPMYGDRASLVKKHILTNTLPLKG